MAQLRNTAQETGYQLNLLDHAGSAILNLTPWRLWCIPSPRVS
jgi:hypothetical protein